MRDVDARTRALILLLNSLTMFIAAAVVLVALYVLAATQLLALLPERREQITAWLGERLEMRIEVDHVDTDMRLLTPVVHLRGVRVFVPDALETPALAAPVIDLELAPFRSLWARQPVLDLLRIEGIDLVIEETPDGEFRIKGMPFRVNDPDAAERLAQALRVVYAQRDIVVERAQVRVESERMPFTAIAGISLRMHNDGDSHALAGSATAVGQGKLPLSFVMRFPGTPLVPADIAADIYVRAHPASLEGWLPRRDLGENVWLDSLAGGGEAWLRLERGLIGDVRGRLQIDSMSASLGDGSKVEGLLGLTTNFHWRSPQPAQWRDAWALSLGQLNFRRQGRAWPEADAAIEFNRVSEDAVRVRAMVSRGSIEMLAGLAPLLPPEHAEAAARVLRLAPRGQLRDVRLQWDGLALPQARWHVQAGIAQAAWQADGGLPGVSGVAGELDISPESGVATLALRGSVLQWPAQFVETIAVDEAAAKLVWHRTAEDGWLLRSNRFTLRNPDARASGLFTLSLPAAGTAPTLSLLGLIEEGRGAATARYLPAGVSDGVRGWLGSALQQGRLRRGSFLAEGPLGQEPAAVAQRTFQMRFEADGIGLAFLPDWPALAGADADVFIEGARVEATGRNARLLDSALDAIRVSVVPNDKGQTQLDVQAHVNGELGNAFTLFQAPLRTVVPAELLSWNGSGRLDAQVRVSMPLGADDATRQRVTVEGSVSGGRLDSPLRELAVDDVSGRVRFDSRDGFSARDLRGTALGTVLVGSARTVAESGRQQTLVDLRGRLRMQPVTAWLKLPVLDVLRGDADAAMTLRFGAGSDSVMEVRSELRGIASTAPAPLGKAAETAVDTRFTWALGTETPRMTLQYGKALAADVFVENSMPARGVVSLGGARLPAAAEGRGLVVEGNTASLSLPDWQALLQRMVEPRAASGARDTPVARTVAGIASLGDRLQRANITVERMDTGALVLDAAGLRISRSDQGFLVALTSKQFDAALQVPLDYRVGDERPLDVQINRLSLPASASASAAAQGGGAVLSPLVVPSLKLSARNLRIGNEDYGNWSMEAKAQADGLHFSNVTGNWRALDIYGQGTWLVDDGGQHSQFTGLATTEDIARVSEAFGFQPNLSSTSAKFDFSLAWRGRPDDIDVQRVNGTLAMDLRNGRFVTASARSQALRALGVFNVGTWQRRMKLDFTDLYKRGVAFDTLTGDVTVNDGRLASSNLVAKGPAAMFEVSGSTELASQALDTRVRVTLPVNSNLYVGCLAGLAACAGIVAFEQLWGDRLEKLTTLGYDVRGTWEDPQVKQIENGLPAKEPQG
jgi:uncharacterized protein (TIGR02099 family)